MIETRNNSLHFILLLACAMLVSCVAPSPAASTATPALRPATPVSSSTEDTFVISAWMDNPTPSRGDKVILYGNLKMGSVIINHLMMTATWPDMSQQRGTPNCYVMVNYQRGVCVIDSGKYPPGEFVPIQISFDYRGRHFTAQTGFTPQ